MNNLVEQAQAIKDKSYTILASIIFTGNKIDNFSLAEDEYDIEGKLKEALSLLGKLKVDYLEWRKLEAEYEILRKKVNQYYEKELLFPWEPLPDMDFSIEK
jgi:hypothetical protein